MIFWLIKAWNLAFSVKKFHRVIKGSISIVYHKKRKIGSLTQRAWERLRVFLLGLEFREDAFKNFTRNIDAFTFYERLLVHVVEGIRVNFNDNVVTFG